MATLKTGIGSKWALGINGRGYLLSTLDQQSPFEFRAYSIEPIPLRVPRVDNSSEPGEQTLGSLWPRSQHSWHEGSGQEVLDSEFSSRYKSKLVWNGDPFTDKGLIKPNPGYDTDDFIDKEYHDMIVVNDFLFGFDGTYIEKYVTKGSSTYQGRLTEAMDAVSRKTYNIATDGSLIYFWKDGSGLYSITTGTDWSSSPPSPTKINNLVDGTAMAFVKDRLMVGIGPAMHDITDLTSLTSGATAHFTHQFSNWIWTCFVEGGPGIFASGYSGGKSSIYHIGFDASTAASGLVLNAPRSVWEAPMGEQILSMASYLGSAILIGTNKGLRNAIIDREGNLQVSTLIVRNSKWNPSDKIQLYKAVLINGEYGFFSHGVNLAAGGDYEASVGMIDLGNLAWCVYEGAHNKSSNYLISSLVIWGDDLVISGNSQTVQVQSGLSSLPVLVTGDIRFGTSEVKVLRKLDVKLSILEPGWVMSTHTSDRGQVLKSDLKGGRNMSTDTDDNVKRKRVIVALVKYKDFINPPSGMSTIAVTHGDLFGSTPNSNLKNEDILWEAVIATANEDGSGDTNRMSFRWRDGNRDLQEAKSSVTLATMQSGGYVDNDTWTYFAWEFDGDVGGAWRVRFYVLQWDSSIGDGGDYTGWDQVGSDIVGGSVSEFHKPTPNIDYPIFIGGGEASDPATPDRISFVRVYESTVTYDNPILSWKGSSSDVDIYGNLFTRVPRDFSSADATFVIQSPLRPLDLDSHFGDDTDISSVSLSIDGGPLEILKYPSPWGSETLKLYGQNSFDLGNIYVGSRFDLRFNGSVEDGGLSEWRLRAEPIPKPRYSIHYVPVMLYDRMITLDGQHMDRKGWAKDELAILKDLYREGTLIDFQPPDLGDSIKVRIDELRFKAFAPPKGALGFGGIALLTLKEQE